MTTLYKTTHYINNDRIVYYHSNLKDAYADFSHQIDGLKLGDMVSLEVVSAETGNHLQDISIVRMSSTGLKAFVNGQWL